MMNRPESSAIAPNEVPRRVTVARAIGRPVSDSATEPDTRPVDSCADAGRVASARASRQGTSRVHLILGISTQRFELRNGAPSTGAYDAHFVLRENKRRAIGRCTVPRSSLLRVHISPDRPRTHTHRGAAMGLRPIVCSLTEQLRAATW